MNSHATEVIEALGGTVAVARLFGISMPSVSNWKNEGIPSARMMFLRVSKRRELSAFNLDAATASRRITAKDSPNAVLATTQPNQEVSHG